MGWELSLKPNTVEWCDYLKEVVLNFLIFFWCQDLFTVLKITEALKDLYVLFIHSYHIRNFKGETFKIMINQFCISISNIF